MRAVAVIDGEHYAPVVRDALSTLPHDIVAAVLVGGTEKIRGGEEYGVPLASGLEAAIAEFGPELVLDLSDEPVLGPPERMRLASRVLAHGIAYEGSDFRFDAPVFTDVGLPSLGIVGTGKRVGKTAVTGHVARVLAREHRVVVVAMGRGGPPEPEVVQVPPTVDALLELSRAGRHAASDHLETAACVGVQTVGCRRCGGGLAGAVAVSNVIEGARLAASLDPELVLFDGSGAALPPVATGRRIVVVGASQDPRVATGYLNEYRLLLADLVVLTMAEDGTDHASIAATIAERSRPDVAVVGTVLRPRPLEPVAGRTVAYFGTAPPTHHRRIADHLTRVEEAEVTHVSGNLSSRPALLAELDRVHAEVFVLELKAAAVDVVVEHARARDIDVVLAANDVVTVSGDVDLDEEIRRLAAEVISS